MRICQFCFNFGENPIDSTDRLGANTAEHASHMELYIILATLENFEYLESACFNHKTTSSQAKLVKCSLAMVAFSLDKINILQSIKHLFSAIALSPRVPGGMNTG